MYIEDDIFIRIQKTMKFILNTAVHRIRKRLVRGSNLSELPQR